LAFFNCCPYSIYYEYMCVCLYITTLYHSYMIWLRVKLLQEGKEFLSRKRSRKWIDSENNLVLQLETIYRYVPHNLQLDTIYRYVPHNLQLDTIYRYVPHNLQLETIYRHVPHKLQLKTIYRYVPHKYHSDIKWTPPNGGGILYMTWTFTGIEQLMSWIC